MKNRNANTLQQKLGFLDDDLKKPVHDDIMYWLNDNIEKILNRIYHKPIDFSEQRQDILNRIPKVIGDRNKIIAHYEEQLNKATDEKRIEKLTNEIETERRKIAYLEKWDNFEILPEQPAIKIDQKIWEHPVTTQGQYRTGSSSKYTVGFIDMAVKISLTKGVSAFGLTNKEIGMLEGAFLGGNYNDITGRPTLHFFSESKWIFIEVKTEIKSLGELIRQIQHYKAYLNDGDYYVLCPETKHEKILREQGIGFIEYP